MFPDVFFQSPEIMREAFIYGDCWYLAQTMQAERGHPILTVSGVEWGWIHAGNLLPDGSVLDVEGIWDPKVWLSRWDATIAQENRSYYGEGFWVQSWDAQEFQQEITYWEITTIYQESEYVMSCVEDLIRQAAQVGIRA